MRVICLLVAAQPFTPTTTSLISHGERREVTHTSRTLFVTPPTASRCPDGGGAERQRPRLSLTKKEIQEWVRYTRPRSKERSFVYFGTNRLS